MKAFIPGVPRKDFIVQALDGENILARIEPVEGSTPPMIKLTLNGEYLVDESGLFELLRAVRDSRMFLEGYDRGAGTKNPSGAGI